MESLRHSFGLAKDPFPQDVPIRDLYPLPSLAPLEKRVFFAIQQRAISVITGNVGTGKSTSLRYVCSKCHQSEYHLIPLVGGPYSLMELHRQILLAFGVSFQSYQLSIMVQKVRELIMEIASRKMVPLLIIDEAHLLKPPVFTQLHTLVQFEFDSRPILPVILCGQELLLDHLMATRAKPLASRVLGRNHLEPLKKEIMKEYLLHHLKLSGCDKNLFSEEAVFAIHQSSGGLLRTANHLAKTAMMAAAMEKASVVSPEHVRLASTEVFM
jgi:general secretion pathway protein A